MSEEEKMFTRASAYINKIVTDGAEDVKRMLGLDSQPPTATAPVTRTQRTRSTWSTRPKGLNSLA